MCTALPLAAQSSEMEDHTCRNSTFPFVDTEIVRKQLYLLSIHEDHSTRWDSFQSTKGAADVTAGPLLTIYNKSWEVSAVGKLANVSSVYKPFLPSCLVLRTA